MDTSNTHPGDGVSKIPLDYFKISTLLSPSTLYIMIHNPYNQSDNITIQLLDYFLEQHLEQKGTQL